MPQPPPMATLTPLLLSTSITRSTARASMAITESCRRGPVVRWSPTCCALATCATETLRAECRLPDEQRHRGCEKGAHHDVERAPSPLRAQRALDDSAEGQPDEAARQRSQHEDKREQRRLQLHGAAALV